MAGVNLQFTLFGRDASASRAIKGVGDESEKTHGKLGRMGGIGKTAGLAIAGGAAAAATGAVVAGKALWGMAQGAAADEAAQKRLALGLANTTGATRGQVASVEEWISSQGTALGVTDDELRPALQRLAQSTGDVTKAQGLASLAMDVSKGTGKDLETVSAALGRAYDGNTGALGRLGVKTKDAEGNALSFDQIQKNLASTFSGQASTAADTFEGRMGRLNLMFGEAQESVGAALLPTLTKLGGWLLDKGVPALKDLGEKIGPKVKEMFDGLKRTIDENRPGLEKLGTIVGQVANFVVTKLLPAWMKFQGFIWSSVIKTLSKLGEILPPIVSGYLSGASKIVGAFRGLYTGVTAALEGILTVAEKTLGWIPNIGPKIKDARANFSAFRDTSTQKLRDVEAGLKAASEAVGDFGKRSKALDPTKLKADISDLTGKIADARRKLKDPDLSKERRAQLTADITELKVKVQEAKRKLSEVKDRRVSIGVDVVVDGKTVGYKQKNGVTQPIGKVYAWAQGAVVRAGFGGRMGVIGEGQYDEAVIPLKPGTTMGGGGLELHVHFDSPIIGSPQDLARYVTQAQRELKRAMGGQPLGIA